MFFTAYYLLIRLGFLPGLTMERAKMELNPPRDKLLLVFLTLMIHGVGTLMPWNMFITAKSVSSIYGIIEIQISDTNGIFFRILLSLQYFVDYKLSQNYTGVESEYGTYFLSYVGFASQIPNLLFNWLNIFMNLG